MDAPAPPVRRAPRKAVRRRPSLADVALAAITLVWGGSIAASIVAQLPSHPIHYTAPAGLHETGAALVGALVTVRHRARDGHDDD